MNLSGFFELRQVCKRYGSLRAVDRVSVSIGKGEVFSILGPSGCGKTTLLKVAAGFEVPDHGSVLIEGEDMTSLPANRRPINTIFQNYALFPHLSLRDNIAFGPRAAGWPKDRIASQVERMLEMIDMKAHAGKKPSQVSGGQKQRVAIARALINQPKVLLLDEPLAALDLKLRQRMLLELDRIHREVGTTFIFVTHDQGEAMSLSNRVAVMNRGRIEQIGSPTEIYESPQSRFVASFIGDTHFLDGGKIEKLLPEDYCQVLLPNLPPAECHNPLGKAVGQAVTVSLRPEKLRLHPQPPAPAALQNVIKGKIEDIIYAGAETQYFVRSGDCRLRVPRRNNHHSAAEGPLHRGDEAWVSWHGKDACLLPAQENEDDPPE